MSNPMEGLLKIYNESVAKADETGSAALFKTATEHFISGLKIFLSEHNVTNTEIDLEYRDGYFLFGTGTNSVINFHISNCPGWLFGLWYSLPKNSDTDKVDYEFFAQYEETIDKFKPSASEIETQGKIFLNSEPSIWTAYEAFKQILFIINEPYLAFCRDYHQWDYNIEYHTREEAKTEFEKYKNQKELEETLTRKFNERILNFVTEKILPQWKDSKISENKIFSPKYQITAPLQANLLMNEDINDYEAGHYDLFDTEDSYEMDIQTEFNALCKNLCDEAAANKIYWRCPINQNTIFLTKD